MRSFLITWIRLLWIAKTPLKFSRHYLLVLQEGVGITTCGPYGSSGENVIPTKWKSVVCKQQHRKWRYFIELTVYPKKYTHVFCFAVRCCGYTLTDFPIPIRLTSLALWQSNDCPSASKATLMNMDKYLMWIHYERLHNHNKAKHNKTLCIFVGIYCRNPHLDCTCSPVPCRVRGHLCVFWQFHSK